MAKRRGAALPPPTRRASRQADWAFRADDDAVLRALASGEHYASLREYFGAPAYAELSLLAVAAKNSKKPRKTRVLILPGIMGSKLGSGARRGSAVVWLDPLGISDGRLKDLALPSRRPLQAVGVLLFSYTKLKLQLQIQGCEASFYAYDWRLGIDELGAQLAAKIAAEDKPVTLIAHSMGGLVARVAARIVPKRMIARLIMLGTPHHGSFASVQALRGTYPFVRKLSMLDRKHSADYLAKNIFRTFPGLYHMLPSPRRCRNIDLYDPKCWPTDGPPLNTGLLRQAAAVRRRLAAADSRMVLIIGINQETVVGLRSTSAGFEYSMNNNGDGTVPLGMATLPKVKAYFVEELHANLANNAQVIRAILDLLRHGRTRELPRRWRAKRGPLRRTDDASLRLAGAGKIDWRRLNMAQREATLGELDSGRLLTR